MRAARKNPTAASGEDAAAAGFLRASRLEARGDVDAAARELDRALKFAPDNPKVLDHKAAMLCDQGRMDEGIALFERLVAERFRRAEPPKTGRDDTAAATSGEEPRLRPVDIPWRRVKRLRYTRALETALLALGPCAAGAAIRAHPGLRERRARSHTGQLRSQDQGSPVRDLRRRFPGVDFSAVEALGAERWWRWDDARGAEDAADAEESAASAQARLDAFWRDVAASGARGVVVVAHQDILKRATGRDLGNAEAADFVLVAGSGGAPELVAGAGAGAPELVAGTGGGVPELLVGTGAPMLRPAGPSSDAAAAAAAALCRDARLARREGRVDRLRRRGRRATRGVAAAAQQRHALAHQVA